MVDNTQIASMNMLLMGLMDKNSNKQELNYSKETSIETEDLLTQVAMEVREPKTPILLVVLARTLLTYQSEPLTVN